MDAASPGAAFRNGAGCLSEVGRTGCVADRPSIHLCSVTKHATQGKGVDTSYFIHKMKIIINARIVGIIEIYCMKQLA